jgi:hypothetical protein
MRSFNLKGEWLVEDPLNESPDPGRTIYPEKLRMAEPGWVARNWVPHEMEVRRECEVSDVEFEAARDWLRHVEAGRIG